MAYTHWITPTYAKKLDRTHSASAAEQMGEWLRKQEKKERRFPVIDRLRSMTPASIVFPPPLASETVWAKPASIKKGWDEYYRNTIGEGKASIADQMGGWLRNQEDNETFKRWVAGGVEAIQQAEALKELHPCWTFDYETVEKKRGN